MKTVQSDTREYQLVAKTKRKDIDGVVYLVAGEKDIWVKLLKDRSSAKEEEVRTQIANGYSSMFDMPLEIVRDGSKFTGYTFKGPEMDVVPVQETPAPTAHGSHTGSMSGFGGPAHRPSSSVGQKTDGNAVQTLALIGEGILLFALNYFVLNNLFLRMVYNSFATNILQGCSLLGVKGAVSGVAGIVLTVFVFKKILSGQLQLAVALLAGFAIFFLGIFAADAVILLLVLVIVAVVGTVQAYISVIVTVIVLVVMVKLIFFS